VIPLALLPRICPYCHDATIVGHGRRQRTAHDDRHEWIWVRRGLCPPCRKSFTILPLGVLPFGHYSLRCHQQAGDARAAGAGAEQAAPDCRNATRSPDPSTLRRWAQPPLLSLCRAFTGLLDRFLGAPTIFAWDPAAACRILPIEARSP
jgi:hypothetical protein